MSRKRRRRVSNDEACGGCCVVAVLFGCISCVTAAIASSFVHLVEEAPWVLVVIILVVIAGAILYVQHAAQELGRTESTYARPPTTRETHSLSIYDPRTKPAHVNHPVARSYCNNPHILKWWTSSHDQLIVKQIENDQWLWYWGITDEIVRITPTETIDAWQQEDGLCSQYAWNNI